MYWRAPCSLSWGNLTCVSVPSDTQGFSTLVDGNKIEPSCIAVGKATQRVSRSIMKLV